MLRGRDIISHLDAEISARLVDLENDLARWGGKFLKYALGLFAQYGAKALGADGRPDPDMVSAAMTIFAVIEKVLERSNVVSPYSSGEMDELRNVVTKYADLGFCIRNKTMAEDAGTEVAEVGPDPCELHSLDLGADKVHYESWSRRVLASEAYLEKFFRDEKLRVALLGRLSDDTHGEEITYDEMVLIHSHLADLSEVTAQPVLILPKAGVQQGIDQIASGLGFEAMLYRVGGNPWETPLIELLNRGQEAVALFTFMFAPAPIWQHEYLVRYLRRTPNSVSGTLGNRWGRGFEKYARKEIGGRHSAARSYGPFRPSRIVLIREGKISESAWDPLRRIGKENKFDLDERQLLDGTLFCISFKALDLELRSNMMYHGYVIKQELFRRKLKNAEEILLEVETEAEFIAANPAVLGRRIAREVKQICALVITSELEPADITIAGDPNRLARMMTLESFLDAMAGIADGSELNGLQTLPFSASESKLDPNQ